MLVHGLTGIFAFIFILGIYVGKSKEEQILSNYNNLKKISNLKSIFGLKYRDNWKDMNTRSERKSRCSKEHKTNKTRVNVGPNSVLNSLYDVDLPIQVDLGKENIYSGDDSKRELNDIKCSLENSDILKVNRPRYRYSNQFSESLKKPQFHDYPDDDDMETSTFLSYTIDDLFSTSENNEGDKIECAPKYETNPDSNRDLLRPFAHDSPGISYKCNPKLGKCDRNYLNIHRRDLQSLYDRNEQQPAISSELKPDNSVDGFPGVNTNYDYRGVMFSGNNLIKVAAVPFGMQDKQLYHEPGTSYKSFLRARYRRHEPDKIEKGDVVDAEGLINEVQSDVYNANSQVVPSAELVSESLFPVNGFQHELDIPRDIKNQSPLESKIEDLSKNQQDSAELNLMDLLKNVDDIKSVELGGDTASSSGSSSDDNCWLQMSNANATDIITTTNASHGGENFCYNDNVGSQDQQNIIQDESSSFPQDMSQTSSQVANITDNIPGTLGTTSNVSESSGQNNSDGNDYDSDVGNVLDLLGVTTAVDQSLKSSLIDDASSAKVQEQEAEIDKKHHHAEFKNKLKNLQNDLKMVAEVQNILTGAKQKSEKSIRRKRAITSLPIRNIIKRKCHRQKNESQNLDVKPRILTEVKELGKILEWQRNNKAKTSKNCDKSKRFLSKKKKKKRKKKRKKKKWPTVSKFSLIQQETGKLTKRPYEPKQERDLSEFNERVDQEDINIGKKSKREENWFRFKWPRRGGRRRGYETTKTPHIISESSKSHNSLINSWHDFNWQERTTKNSLTESGFVAKITHHVQTYSTPLFSISKMKNPNLSHNSTTVKHNSKNELGWHQFKMHVAVTTEKIESSTEKLHNGKKRTEGWMNLNWTHNKFTSANVDIHFSQKLTTLENGNNEDFTRGDEKTADIGHDEFSRTPFDYDTLVLKNSEEYSSTVRNYSYFDETESFEDLRSEFQEDEDFSTVDIYHYSTEDFFQSILKTDREQKFDQNGYETNSQDEQFIARENLIGMNYLSSSVISPFEKSSEIEFDSKSDQPDNLEGIYGQSNFYILMGMTDLGRMDYSNTSSSIEDNIENVDLNNNVYTLGMSNTEHDTTKYEYRIGLEESNKVGYNSDSLQFQDSSTDEGFERLLSNLEGATILTTSSNGKFDLNDDITNIFTNLISDGKNSDLSVNVFVNSPISGTTEILGAIGETNQVQNELHLEEMLKKSSLDEKFPTTQIYDIITTSYDGREHFFEETSDEAIITESYFDISTDTVGSVSISHEYSFNRKGDPDTNLDSFSENSLHDGKFITSGDAGSSDSNVDLKYDELMSNISDITEMFVNSDYNSLSDVNEERNIPGENTLQKLNLLSESIKLSSSSHERFTDESKTGNIMFGDPEDSSYSTNFNVEENVDNSLEQTSQIFKGEAMIDPVSESAKAVSLSYELFTENSESTIFFDNENNLNNDGMNLSSYNSAEFNYEGNFDKLMNETLQAVNEEEDTSSVPENGRSGFLSFDRFVEKTSTASGNGNVMYFDDGVELENSEQNSENTWNLFTGTELLMNDSTQFYVNGNFDNTEERTSREMQETETFDDISENSKLVSLFYERFIEVTSEELDDEDMIGEGHVEEVEPNTLSSFRNYSSLVTKILNETDMLSVMVSNSNNHFQFTENPSIYSNQITSGNMIIDKSQHDYDIIDNIHKQDEIPINTEESHIAITSIQQKGGNFEEENDELDKQSGLELQNSPDYDEPHINIDLRAFNNEFTKTENYDDYRITDPNIVTLAPDLPNVLQTFSIPPLLIGELEKHTMRFVTDIKEHKRSSALDVNINKNVPEKNSLVLNARTSTLCKICDEFTDEHSTSTISSNIKPSSHYVSSTFCEICDESTIAHRKKNKNISELSVINDTFSENQHTTKMFSNKQKSSTDDICEIEESSKIVGINNKHPTHVPNVKELSSNTICEICENVNNTVIRSHTMVVTEMNRRLKITPDHNSGTTEGVHSFVDMLTGTQEIEPILKRKEKVIFGGKVPSELDYDVNEIKEFVDPNDLDADLLHDNTEVDYDINQLELINDVSRTTPSIHQNETENIASSRKMVQAVTPQFPDQRKESITTQVVQNANHAQGTSSSSAISSVTEFLSILHTNSSYENKKHDFDTASTIISNDKENHRTLKNFSGAELSTLKVFKVDSSHVTFSEEHSGRETVEMSINNQNNTESSEPEDFDVDNASTVIANEEISSLNSIEDFEVFNQTKENLSIEELSSYEITKTNYSHVATPLLFSTRSNIANQPVEMTRNYSAQNNTEPLESEDYDVDDTSTTANEEIITSNSIKDFGVFNQSSESEGYETVKTHTIMVNKILSTTNSGTDFEEYNRSIENFSKEEISSYGNAKEKYSHFTSPLRLSTEANIPNQPVAVSRINETQSSESEDYDSAKTRTIMVDNESSTLHSGTNFEEYNRSIENFSIEELSSFQTTKIKYSHLTSPLILLTGSNIGNRPVEVTGINQTENNLQSSESEDYDSAKTRTIMVDNESSTLHSGTNFEEYNRSIENFSIEELSSFQTTKIKYSHLTSPLILLTGSNIENRPVEVTGINQTENNLQSSESEDYDSAKTRTIMVDNESSTLHSGTNFEEYNRSIENFSIEELSSFQTTKIKNPHLTSPLILSTGSNIENRPVEVTGINQTENILQQSESEGYDVVKTSTIIVNEELSTMNSGTAFEEDNESIDHFSTEEVSSLETSEIEYDYLTSSFPFSTGSEMHYISKNSKILSKETSYYENQNNYSTVPQTITDIFSDSEKSHSFGRFSSNASSMTLSSYPALESERPITDLDSRYGTQRKENLKSIENGTTDLRVNYDTLRTMNHLNVNEEANSSLPTELLTTGHTPNGSTIAKLGSIDKSTETHNLTDFASSTDGMHLASFGSIIQSTKNIFPSRAHSKSVIEINQTQDTELSEKSFSPMILRTSPESPESFNSYPTSMNNEKMDLNYEDLITYDYHDSMDTINDYIFTFSKVPITMEQESSFSQNTSTEKSNFTASEYTEVKHPGLKLTSQTENPTPSEIFSFGTSESEVGITQSEDLTMVSLNQKVYTTEVSESFHGIVTESSAFSKVQESLKKHNTSHEKNVLIEESTFSEKFFDTHNSWPEEDSTIRQPENLPEEISKPTHAEHPGEILQNISNTPPLQKSETIDKGTFTDYPYITVHNIKSTNVVQLEDDDELRPLGSSGFSRKLNISTTLMLLLTSVTSNLATFSESTEFQTRSVNSLSSIYIDLPVFIPNTTKSVPTENTNNVPSDTDNHTMISTGNVTSKLKNQHCMILYVNRPGEGSRILNGTRWVLSGPSQKMEPTTVVTEKLSVTELNIPRNLEIDKCSEDNIHNNSECFCVMDNLLSSVRQYLKNVNELSIVNCSNLIKVRKGLVIGNDSVPVKRIRRSYLYGVKDEEKRNSIDYSSDYFQFNFSLNNSENKVFCLQNSKITIRCLNDDKQLEYNRYTKYSWTFNDKLPISGQIQEEDGSLVIDSVLPKDGGNYTCILNPNSEEKEESALKSYHHALVVVSTPIFKIRSSIIYSLNETCDLLDADIIYSYIPSLFDDLLCGFNHKVCKVDIKRPKCLKGNQEKTFINVTFITTMIYLPQILPDLDNNVCDINCQMNICLKLAQAVLRNIRIIAAIPVLSRIDVKELDFIPTQIISGLENNHLRSLPPMLIISCPGGFGVHKSYSKLCVACPTNTYSPESESFCKTCPPGQYQPVAGSKTCIVCSSPLENSACLKVLYTKGKHFEMYLGFAFGGVALMILGIIYCSTRKPPGQKVATRNGKNIKTRKSNDLERGLTEPLLKSKKPPELPSPDFSD